MTALARNAQSLIDLRMRGIRPELPVLVSLVGALEFENVTLIADPKVRYDWRAIGGLDVEVIASTAVTFPSLLQTLADLALGVPKRMILTFREGPSVECGEWRQITDFKVFDWFPMPLAHAAWGESRKLASRLLDEVGKTLPIPYDEALNLVIQLANEGKPWHA
ncbi:histidine ammonia-lyase [Burkholderia stagnalis]|uniref:hypothetical protein n=1 Tax=Burkholderia stagnalis TaxID=1503054 RepID=UPI0007529716|nr:hypothetical protein [Burkholderia stagnalis]KVN72794.1 histidine ammonia-lyase [Burkholderia stagnalis]KWO38174.1 histidine ammonia-lyase [Burkholderia stagnalis]KWO41104.1 histidine ammonia-lyase [Burkholderia stagnalis]